MTCNDQGCYRRGDYSHPSRATWIVVVMVRGSWWASPLGMVLVGSEDDLFFSRACVASLLNLKPLPKRHAWWSNGVLYPRELWSVPSPRLTQEGARCAGFQRAARCPQHKGSSLFLSCSWRSYSLRAGQTLKEGRRGVPFGEVVDEAEPMGEPMLSCSRDNRCPAVFHGVHRHYWMFPLQRTPQSMPEIG